jgi:hypothetical protein
VKVVRGQRTAHVKIDGGGSYPVVKASVIVAKD